MDKMKIKKTGKSKHGYWLLDEESNFTGTTEQVSKFLEDQVPCEVEVSETDGEGRNLKVTRVKVLGSQKPAEKMETASNYKPSVSTDREESIRNQFFIRESIRLIEVANQVSSEKILPTKGNVYNNALLLKEVYDRLMSEKDLPDY